MKQFSKKITIQTKQQFEIVDITKMVSGAIAEFGINSGMVVISSQHTTASIRINHFEPLLVQDLLRAMYRLIPQDINYNHDLFELRQNVTPGERSNGHAHVKAFLLGSSETIIIEHGELQLGPRQSVLFVDLDGGRKREFILKIIGE